MLPVHFFVHIILGPSVAIETKIPVSCRIERVTVDNNAPYSTHPTAIAIPCYTTSVMICLRRVSISLSLSSSTLWRGKGGTTRGRGLLQYSLNHSLRMTSLNLNIYVSRYALVLNLDTYTLTTQLVDIHVHVRFRVHVHLYLAEYKLVATLTSYVSCVVDRSAYLGSFIFD